MSAQEDGHLKKKTHVKTEGWSEATTSQGTPRTSGKPPAVKNKQGRLPLHISEAHFEIIKVIDEYSRGEAVD